MHRRSLVSLALTGALLALPGATAAAQRSGDVINVARNAGQFATLLAAVDAANLTQTLRGNGPYTVFAPTDEAFRKLPAGTVENLLKPENREQLQALLLYHVVPGRVSAATARTLSSAATVEGRNIRIRAEGAALRINSARVITADVNASNGVIHVIDEVLMPPTSGSSAERDMQTASAQNAREVIELAIRRGVPLFNDGNEEATAAIYEVAARAVLGVNDLSSTARRSLERGLRDAQRENDVAEKAWVLRRALDDADRALDGRMRMTARSH